MKRKSKSMMNIQKKFLFAATLVMLMISQSCFAAEESTAATEAEIDKAMTEECRAFAKDPDADLGKVIKAGCKPTLAQMSKLMDNPLGNVAMLFTQYDSYHMQNDANGEEGIHGVYMGIAQFPKKLSENWTLINRIVWTVPSMPIDQDKIDDFDAGQYGNIPPTVTPPSGKPAPIRLFDGRTTGFGDMYYVGLFTPAEGTKLDNGANLLWGLGFDLGFPTASEDILGTGKWTAGPSALGVYLGEKLKTGALLQHYWDYAGDSDRSDVNMSNLQYLYYWSLNETTSVGAAPNIIINWEENSDNALTLPIGIGMNKTVQMGKVPVRFGAEVFYSVVQPDDVPATEWSFRFYAIPAVPSALFSWMN